MYDTSENYKDNANLSVSPVRITEEKKKKTRKKTTYLSVSPVRITGMMHVNLCHRWGFQIWWTSICVKGEDVTGENYSYVERLPLSPVKATGWLCCLICSRLLSFVPFCVFSSPCIVSFCLFVCLFDCLIVCFLLAPVHVLPPTPYYVLWSIKVIDLFTAHPHHFFFLYLFSLLCYY